MNIPIGKNYVFNLKVYEPDSFITLDVTGYAGTMNIYKREDNSNVVTRPLTPSDKVIETVVDGVTVSTTEAANGIMVGTIPGTETAGIIPAKGSAADDYYIKDEYAGFISITKAGETDINVTIDSVTFMPTGA